MIDMLKGYYNIYKRRNQINHAANNSRSDESMKETKKNLVKLMVDYLVKLKEFK